MKYYFILGCLFLFSNLTFAQEAAFDVAVKNAAGEVVNFQDMVQDGRPKVVVFWATFCAGCKLEMKAINFFDQKWNDEFGADVLAISIDAPGNFEKANQLLADKG
ncbi:MAG: redoxin domain-containing protein, partial [Saprospiraceae bacterium]|nr:redoxin domain-containing protein [Saprospiraceae bacterium]